MASPLPLISALANLPVYQPGRPIDEVARDVGLAPETIIKLASNENPLGPSPRAVAAMQKAISQVHLYPDGSAFHLKRALARQLGVEPPHLILGNGSNELLELVGHALLGPDAEVVVSEYCFAVYPIVTHLFGAKLVTVPARAYGHDLEAMLDAITPRTRIVFVANPNNPTGTLASREDIVELVNRVPDHVLLAMDEAYLDFLEDPVDLIPLARDGVRPNLLLMRTFSKIYGLAGLRLGYGIGCADLVSALEKIRQPFNINAIAQAGALAALEDREHYQATRANNARGLQQLQTAFAKMGLAFVPSAANFVLVRVGDGSGVFQRLQKQGVIVRPMAGYGLPDWIRISVGTPAENARCLEALTLALPAR